MKIVFETESCTRCDGTGEYSYNPMYGRTCFKCAGGKVQLTRSGSFARKRYDEALAAMRTPITEIAPDSKVKYEGKWWQCRSIAPTKSGRKDRNNWEMVLVRGSRQINLIVDEEFTALVFDQEKITEAMIRTAKLKGAKIVE